MPELESVHCRDCGEIHRTAGEAHACDHRLSRTYPERAFLRGDHLRNAVKGCPLCAAPSQNRAEARKTPT